jgi:hypothetical protein
MIYLKYMWWKTCPNKINNIFTNFLNKTSSQTWATEVNNSLHFGTEGVVDATLSNQFSTTNDCLGFDAYWIYNSEKRTGPESPSWC